MAEALTSPTAGTSLQMRNVTRSFRRSKGDVVHAVDDFSLSIVDQEFVCLVGPSGCGKSTLLQMLAGLQPVNSGSIVLNGVPIDGPSPERGLVFQRDSVFPWMRVIDNAAYGLAARKIDKASRMKIAREYLQLVGLSHVEHSWPRELSGGMLKRVAVATVFANSPKVLLLDEPFGALDYVTRLQLQGVLLNLWSKTRPIVVFVTHDVDESLLLADRIVVMKSGRLVDDRRVSLARPRTVESLAMPEAVATRRLC
ncbi:MAG: ABC transporter ATP-binding protein [Chloroflexi bacterium]|nr:ABC transporter ATP-binding protein [Chloroflexota bacterium]